MSNAVPIIFRTHHFVKSYILMNIHPLKRRQNNFCSWHNNALILGSIFSSTLEFSWCWFLFSTSWKCTRKHTLVAHSYSQTILSFRIPYAISTVISHSAVPMHCAWQPQRTKCLEEKVTPVRLVLTARGASSAHSCHRRGLRDATTKGASAALTQKMKRVLATSASKQFRLASHNTIGRSEATLATPINKTGTENNINIYFTVKQLWPCC